MNIQKQKEEWEEDVGQVLQEDARQTFKELQDWFLPVSEVAVCTSAGSMELILLLLKKKEANK